MKLSSRLDTYIRRSALSTYISQLRVRAPLLYATTKRVWETIFPMPSTHTLARYQARAVNNFLALAVGDGSKSSILEIGSDAGAKIIRELSGHGVGTVVGINPGTENDQSGAADFRGEDLPPGCMFRNDDATALSFVDETFSHVFSVSVFEHLNDFDTCLSEMYRVLRPGGYMYAEFGPIWSCSIGHHVYAVVGNEEARHWDPRRNPVPSFAHLLMTRGELASHLQADVSEKLLEAILDWIYDQPFINRLFYEDYLRVIEASPFEMEHLACDKEHIGTRTKERLGEKHPDYSVFDVRNVELLLRKK